MDLREDNPYSIGFITLFGNNLQSLDSVKPKLNKTASDRLYTTIEGDTFSNIAFEAYGNSKYWWLIWFANSIDFPFDLEILPNTTLLIPDLENFNSLNS